MTAVFVESEYEIELAGVQGPAGPGLSAIANNTLLGNISGSSATPIANALKTYIGQKSVFANDAILAENKTATNVWCYAGANADLNINGSTCLFGGQLSGSAAVTVTDSTSWGIWALRNLQEGNGNTAVGVYAFRDAVTMNAGTAVGDSALMQCLVDHCTAVGYGAGSRHSNGGTGNIFIGSYSGWRGNKGEHNWISGWYSNSFTTGTDEEGVTLGNYNWIHGYTSGYKYTGNHSHIKGYEAGYNIVSGDHNFFDGYQAGAALVAGSHNIFIGAYAGQNALQATTVSNSIGIGQNAFTTADNQVVLGGAAITSTILRGSVQIPSNAWVTSSEASPKNRIFFELDSSTYIRGHGTTPVIFQSGSGANLIRVAPEVFEASVEQLRVINTSAGIALWKDASPTRAGRIYFGGNEVIWDLYDGTAWRTGIVLGSSGTAPQIGFLGATQISRPEVTGSRGGNAALASALTALANLGLITNSST